MPASVRRKFIRATAEDILRRTNHFEAPVNVFEISESLGILVVEHSAEDDLSGFLLRDQETKRVVIGINSAHHENRRRFTIAHELGHFLLHEGEVIHIDKQNESQGFQLNFRNAKSSEGIDVKEKEANLFAAELLMPSKFIHNDLSKLKSIDLLGPDEQYLKDLVEKYAVSLQAFMIRLSYLDYIQF
ncbi:ImmA/IrrE family metallo-endopeptidase [Leptothoe sp. ISB3NOV94-8A]